MMNETNRKDIPIDENKRKNIQTIMNILNVIGLIITILMVVWGAKAGLFTNPEKMYAYITDLGIWGPLVFIIIQIAQTIVPVMPGSITIPIGILAFGPWWGFILNLIPIYFGSIVNFWIARRFGKPTVRAIVGDKSYYSMINLFERKNIGNRLFTLLMFVPFSPADLLCYGAGFTNMTNKYFTYSLLIGKPVSLAFYAFGTGYFLTWIMQNFA
ncbi:TVP38/TMEM64 family protein [Facklamia lactis]|uniref:TVP38/TMEM64 family protein n=1 Tax=Facklamia lactis TaxID=2749967 RepID=UPI001F3FF376|nr:TVP38/TMEM64 family protein [Facklamia lactis]